MKITSSDPLILDELFNELKREHIELIKETKEDKGTMAGCTTVALIVAIAKGIDTLLNTLTFFQNQKNYYIHIKLDDGRVIKLNKLSKEKQESELRAIKKEKNIKTIDIGRA
jgi:hypothetical protein